MRTFFNCHHGRFVARGRALEKHAALLHSHGFSLVELLVSVALFTIVMTVSVGTLLVLINANQKAQSLTSVINNLNFGLESMSRSIRTGLLYNCTNSIPSTLPLGVANCPSGGAGLVLTNDTGGRLAYRYNSTRKNIERRIGNGSLWIALTAPEVVIDDVLFYVTGTVAGDTIQPTVTISIRGHAGTKTSTDSSFNVQTTLTQRLLDQ